MAWARASKVIAGDFTSYDQAKGGMSYCSAQDPRIYFGLGKHEQRGYARNPLAERHTWTCCKIFPWTISSRCRKAIRRRKRCATHSDTRNS